MTDIQLFAFIILPLAIGIAALIGAYVVRRNQMRDHGRPGQ